MTAGHLQVRAHSRQRKDSRSRSAAAAIAYRCGNRCVDAYTGIEHDYSRRSARGEVYNSAIVGPGAYYFGADFAALATAIDSRETRRNACLGRDIDIALPCELREEQQWALLEEAGAFIGRRYETPVLIALHRAPVEGDARNNHGHAFFPSRRFENGEFTIKLRQLDDRRRGRIEVKAIRAGIEKLINRHLERAGSEARISLQRRPDGLAEPHLGAACTAMERRHAEAQGIDVRGMSMRSLLSTPGYTPATVRGVHLQAHHEAVAEIERRREEGERQPLQRAPVVDDETPDAVAPTPRSPRRRPRTRRVKVEDETPRATAPSRRSPRRRPRTRRLKVNQPTPEEIAQTPRSPRPKPRTRGLKVGDPTEAMAQTPRSPRRTPGTRTISVEEPAAEAATAPTPRAPERGPRLRRTMFEAPAPIPAVASPRSAREKPCTRRPAVDDPAPEPPPAQVPMAVTRPERPRKRRLTVKPEPAEPQPIGYRCIAHPLPLTPEAFGWKLGTAYADAHWESVRGQFGRDDPQAEHVAVIITAAEQQSRRMGHRPAGVQMFIAEIVDTIRQAIHDIIEMVSRAAPAMRKDRTELNAVAAEKTAAAAETARQEAEVRRKLGFDPDEVHRRDQARGTGGAPVRPAVPRALTSVPHRPVEPDPHKR